MSKEKKVKELEQQIKVIQDNIQESYKRISGEMGQIWSFLKKVHPDRFDTHGQIKP